MATSSGSRSRRQRFPWWAIAAIAIIVALPFLTGNKSVFTLFTLYHENRALLEEKQRLEAENQRLVEEIARLKNDMEHIERMAREQYHLKRDDEEVYEIVPEERDD